MGTILGAVHPAADGPIVAFDFDGTITCRDSFMAFLRWRVGPTRFGTGLTRLIPAAAAYAVDNDRARLKVAATREFLRGLTIGELDIAATTFAASEGPRLLRPDALRRWRQWRDLGARLVIVTASPEIIVGPFARDLGAQTIVGTRLATDVNGRVDRRFRRPELPRRRKGGETKSRLRA